MARPELLGRTGTGRIADGFGIVGPALLQFGAQGGDLRGGGLFQGVEPLPHFAFEFGSHPLELLHQRVQFALFPQYLDAELFDFGRRFGAELFDTPQKFFDFANHILRFYTFCLILYAI